MYATFCNSNDYLLLLKADEFLRDRSVVAALKNFDGMVCGMAKVPALNRVRHFDDVLCGDPHRPESALMAVKEFEMMTGLKPRAVIPITEMTLTSAQLIAQEYDLPFLSAETVAASRDKVLMKKAFAEFDVPTARYLRFASLEELREAANQLGYPVIVKPVEAAHSIGVRKIDSESDLQAGYEYCTSGLESISLDWGLDKARFQVEEYIESERELSVEIVNVSGEHIIVAITDKFLTEPPFFAEIGHRIPSVESDNEKVRDAAIRACQALGLQYGVAHVEIRVDANGNPFVIEVASRPGGDGIMDLVERAYGINMYEMHIRSYLGDLSREDLQNIQFKGTAAIAFMPSKRGRITHVKLPEKLPREVVSLYLNAKEGDEVGLSMNYDDRLGTAEFFWKDAVNQSDAHLQTIRKIRDDVYNIE